MHTPHHPVTVAGAGRLIPLRTQMAVRPVADELVRAGTNFDGSLRLPRRRLGVACAAGLIAELAALTHTPCGARRSTDSAGAPACWDLVPVVDCLPSPDGPRLIAHPAGPGALTDPLLTAVYSVFRVIRVP